MSATEIVWDLELDDSDPFVTEDAPGEFTVTVGAMFSTPCPTCSGAELHILFADSSSGATLGLFGLNESAGASFPTPLGSNGTISNCTDLPGSTCDHAFLESADDVNDSFFFELSETVVGIEWPTTCDDSGQDKVFLNPTVGGVSQFVVANGYTCENVSLMAAEDPTATAVLHFPEGMDGFEARGVGGVFSRMRFILPGVGNGLVEPGESCDDGNLIDGDGCSALALVEKDFRKCQETSSRFFQKLHDTAVNWETKCRDTLNKSPEKSPVNTPGECLTGDPKLVAKVVSAQLKTAAKIRDKCSDQAVAALPLCDDSTGSVDTLDELISSDGTAGCISESALASAALLVSASFGDQIVPEEKEAVNCQRQIGRQARTLGKKLYKALEKCEKGKLRGKILFETDCFTEDTKAVAAIGKAESKFDANVRKKCSDAIVMGRQICGALDTVDEVINCILAVQRSEAQNNIDRLFN